MGDKKIPSPKTGVLEEDEGRQRPFRYGNELREENPFRIGQKFSEIYSARLRLHRE